MAKEEIRACLLLHPSSPQFGGSQSGDVPSGVARSSPGDRTRSWAEGSSSQPSPPACSCQQSLSPTPWDTLAGSLAPQQEILPQRLQGSCEAEQDCGSYLVPSCLPIPYFPALTKAGWKDSPWSLAHPTCRGDLLFAKCLHISFMLIFPHLLTPSECHMWLFSPKDVDV